MVISCICGVVIGYERKNRAKVAGMRTHCIVACASAMMMIVSKYGFGDLMQGYDKNAFSGNFHRIRVREPEEDELYVFRNISLNSHDRRGQKKYFPHAYANLVTREDVCFFECNAIDGICDNEGHGDYPYHSWAGGAREDLKYYN